MICVDEDPALEAAPRWLGKAFAPAQVPPTDGDLRLIGPMQLATSGARVLRRHRLRAPDVPCVVLTPDDAELELVRACFREGAADVLSLSEAPGELAVCIRRTLDARALERRDREDTAALAAELGKRARELQEMVTQVRLAYDHTLGALVAALDLREEATANHSARVALYALMLGLRAGIDDSGTLRDLYHGSLLHDIGKIGIPDAVLLKPGELSDPEWEIMRGHAKLGGDMLDGIAFLRGARDVPLYHHEAWAGGGYPHGLEADQIPVSARIFAAVDSYDAIRSWRPYKPEHTYSDAVPMLHRVAGRRLDPGMVELFLDQAPESWDWLAGAATEAQTFGDAMAACRECMARGGRSVGK